MTKAKSFQVFITDITSGREYKKLVKNFEKWVETKDRTNDTLHYYLVYDVDHRDYKMRSEYNITYNQIALIKATLPPKRDKDSKPIQYTTFDYNKVEPE